MAIKLQAEQVYHPSRGMNIDANGITARLDEAIDCVNINIESDRVTPRDGTKALELQGDGIGPVLKYHRYVHPTDGTILFAFCASDIYRYDNVYGWISVTASATVFSGIEQWSITNVIDKNYGSTVVVAGSSYTNPTSSYADAADRVLLIYDPDTGFNLYSLASSGAASFEGVFTGALLSTTFDMEIDFICSTAGSVCGGYSETAGISQRVIIYYDGSTNLEVTVGQDTVDVPYTGGYRTVIRVKADGSVYENGALMGTSTTPLVTPVGNAYAMMLYGSNSNGIAYPINDCKIISYTINGTVRYAHADNYFYDISLTTDRVFNQYNSIFLNSAINLQWTESSITAGEWYCELDTTGDPSLTEPEEIAYYAGVLSPQPIYGSELVPGTIGSLADGEWEWGTDAGIAFDTIFIKILAGADPNTVAEAYKVRAVGGDSVAYNTDLVVDDLGVSVDVGFIDMVINKNTYDTETYATAIDSAAPPDTNDWTLSADRAIVSGTAYLVVDTIGVIATAGLAIHKQEFGTSPNITEVDVNFWLPVDEDEIAFGETSYIRLDTGAISVEFLKDTYDGDDLTIYYQFEEEVTYRPLYVSNYHNALVMANTVEYFITATGPEVGEWTYTPWRVRWSEQGNVSLYRENHYQDLALSDISPILGMKSLETSASSNIFGPLYFYKHNSIIRGTYNQSYNLNADFPVPMFNFEIAYSEGIEAFETLVSIEGMHFFLGRNDVYAFNGYERKSLTHDRETGSTRIQKYLFDKLNLDALYRCHGVYDEIKRFYYLFLTYNTASGIYPEDCFVYDIDGGTWIRHTYSGVSAAISLDATLGGAIDNLAGTIDGLGTTTIDSLTANKAKFLLFAIGGYTYYTAAFALDEADINDIAFDPYFISRDFLGTTLEEKDRVQKVILEAKDDTLQVGYSAHYDTAVADFEQLDTLTFSSAYRREPYHPDEVSTSFRLLVRLGANAVFRWLQVFSKKLEFEGE